MHSIAISGAILTLTSACAPSAPPPGEEPEPIRPIIGGPAADPSAPAVDQSHPDARLILGQEVLRGRIYLDQARMRQVGALRQAEVVVINSTQDLFQLEYRVDWQDADDFQVESGAWRRFTLAGNERYAIQSTGGTPQASKINVTVRLPDEVIR